MFMIMPESETFIFTNVKVKVVDLKIFTLELKIILNLIIH